MKVFRLNLVSRYQRLPRFQVVIVLRVSSRPGINSNVLVGIDRPLMRPRIIDQRTVIFVNVLERNPNRTHEPLRNGTEVNAVTVIMLFGAYREVQCLEGKGRTAV